MKRFVLFVVALSALAFALHADRFRFPALSPDGSVAAFTYQGDIWLCRLADSSCQRLTDHEAFEGYARFSPDGKWLAFSGKQYGNYDVFVVPTAGGVPRRLTWHSADDLVNGWSADGRSVIFQSGRENQVSLYRVPFGGGMPQRLFPGYWAVTSNGAVSPDGGRIVFSNSMEAANFWWRRGYRGSFNADVVMYDFAGDTFTTLTDFSGNDFFPVWSTDGKQVFFVSERDGAGQNVYAVDAASKAVRRVSDFRSGTVRWLHAAAGRLIFEREHGLWLLEAATGAAQPLALNLPADAKKSNGEWKEVDRVSAFAAAPDRRKIALIARGDIYVCDPDGKYLTRVTTTAARESEAVWDGASRQLYFVSDRDGTRDIFRLDPLAPEQWTTVYSSPLDEGDLRLSPDGKWLAFRSGKKELRVVNLASSQVTRLYEGPLAGFGNADYQWTADSGAIFLGAAEYWESDIMVVEVPGGKTRRLTNNAFDESQFTLSADGRMLAFSANYEGHGFPERSGQSDLYAVELPGFRDVFAEKLFEKLIVPEEQAGKPAAAEGPVTVAERDFEKRVQRLTDTANRQETNPRFAAEGRKLAFVRDDEKLCTLDFDDFAKPKTPTELYSGVNIQDYCWFRKNGELLVLDDGRLIKVAADGKTTPIPFRWRVEIDRAGEYRQMFDEVWQTLNDWYYDPGFHGVDWRAVREEYRPLIADCVSDEDFYFTMNEMFGELNSSHMGINGPFVRRPEIVTAALGVEWQVDPAAGLFRIGRVVRFGPLYRVAPEVQGEWLLALDGKKVTAADNLVPLLAGKADKRVVLTLRDAKGRQHDVAVKAVEYGQEKTLLYNEWEEACRAEVHRLSGNRVGYVHMKNMGWDEWLRFARELEDESIGRDGVIVDLRYNTGGNVHDQVLGTLVRSVYASWRRRDLPPTTQPTFAVRPKPVTMLINEFSLSDAEMTSSGFKSLKLGPLVGTRTYGWLIFTTERGLLNSGTFRVPYFGCFHLSGADIENNGVEPDIPIGQSLEDRIRGRDPQLERAVRETVKNMGKPEKLE